MKMDWLYAALIVGVLVCLADGTWVPPFRPFYGFRWFLAIAIIVLGIMKFAR